MNFRDRVLMLVACVVTSFTATVAVNLYFRGQAVAEDPETSDTVRLKRLEVVDGDGNLRTVLSTGKDDGMPIMAMTDKDGNVRFSLGVTAAGGSAAAFVDEKGRTRLTLALNPDGSGALVFADPKGKTPLVMAAGDGGAAVNLSDRKDVVRVSMGIEKDGTPNLRWFDADGEEIKKE